MRKVLIVCAILLMTMTVLGACGDQKENEPPKKDNQTEDNQIKDNENESDNNSNQSGSTDKNSDIEDQLNLKIGDTGKFVTVLGSYDMTLHEATLIDDEIEGEKSTRDGFIILDLTIKNSGDENIDLEDVILSMEVASNLEHSGSTDHAHGFETLDAFEGELEPGKEKTAQFMTIVDDTAHYYFRKMVGNIASGSSNQVIWTFSAEEGK